MRHRPLVSLIRFYSLQYGLGGGVGCAVTDWHQKPHLYRDGGLWVAIGPQGLKGFGRTPWTAWRMLSFEVSQARELEDRRVAC